MRPAVVLAFCCACPRVVWAQINFNGEIYDVESGSIRVKLNELVIVRDSDRPLVLVLNGLGIYEFADANIGEDWDLHEFTGENCPVCATLERHKKGTAWRDLPGEEKRRRRQASIQPAKQRKTVSTPPPPKDGDDPDVVRLDDWRKRRDDGRRGKPAHIKDAGREPGEPRATGRRKRRRKGREATA